MRSCSDQDASCGHQNTMSIERGCLGGVENHRLAVQQPGRH
jgi:hypothetical protein